MVPVVTPLASCKVVDIFGVPEDKFALCGFYWKFCHREEERTGIWFVCDLPGYENGFQVLPYCQYGIYMAYNIGG